MQVATAEHFSPHRLARCGCAPTSTNLHLTWYTALLHGAADTRVRSVLFWAGHATLYWYALLPPCTPVSVPSQLSEVASRSRRCDRSPPPADTVIACSRKGCFKHKRCEGQLHIGETPTSDKIRFTVYQCDKCNRVKVYSEKVKKQKRSRLKQAEVGMAPSTCDEAWQNVGKDKVEKKEIVKKEEKKE